MAVNYHFHWYHFHAYQSNWWFDLPLDRGWFWLYLILYLNLQFFFFFVGESEKERYDEVKVVLNWPINGLPVRWVNHIHGFLLWVLWIMCFLLTKENKPSVFQMFWINKPYPQQEARSEHIQNIAISLWPNFALSFFKDWY